MKRILLAIIGLLLAATIVHAASCPIDNSYMYWTGDTTAEMGKLLKKYKCAYGHITWIPSW